MSAPSDQSKRRLSAEVAQRVRDGTCPRCGALKDVVRDRLTLYCREHVSYECRSVGANKSTVLGVRDSDAGRHLTCPPPPKL